jgi:hypothetical protein
MVNLFSFYFLRKPTKYPRIKVERKATYRGLSVKDEGVHQSLSHINNNASFLLCLI